MPLLFLYHHSITPVLQHSNSSALHHSNTPTLQPLYLSFSVLKDRRASTIAMIQKRTVTLDSGHPLSSKW
jgi:hypothetical protein